MSRSRLVKDTVRRLKRRWPTRIVYSRRVRDTAIDPVSGQQTYTGFSFPVKRAILLPKRDIRSFSYDLAYLAGASANMTQGGYFDENTRFIILDAKDLKYIDDEDNVVKITPQVGDFIQWAEFSEVKEVQEIDGSAWIVRTHVTVGVTNVTA